jgi:dihydroorotase
MTKSEILLKNGTVYAVGKSGKIEKLDKEPLDIRISDGVISEIGKTLAPAAVPCEEEVFDLTGLTVLPGFIDLHAQLRDFDLEDVEDFKSGTKSAAAGGFTTVLDYANSRPQRDNINSLREALERVAKNACIEVLLVAAVTQGLAGEQLTNMVELAENGAVAFSDDGLPIMNMGVFRAALSYLALTGRFIISHAEDKHLSGRGAMNESPQSTRLGVPCIPAASEAVSVAREIEVLRLQGGHLHFTHVSTAPSVELIRKARKEGLHVTSDVTPHHLTLLDEHVVTYDGNFKMNPPLRSTYDQKVLLEAVADGTIDTIATDHAPWSALYKIRPFEDCTFGVLGFETAFPLTYEKLVLSGCISFERLIELLTTEPAKILQMKDKQIAKGKEANLAIVDLNHKWTYDVNKSFSKSRNSPFHGRQLQGKTVLTLYKGQVVFQDSSRFAKVLAGK